MRGALLTIVAMPVTALLLLAPAPGAAHAAQSDDRNEVFIEVNPSTVHTGGQVGIRARCDDDQPADIRSRAFPDFTLHPQPGSRLLSGSATIPHDTRAGRYQVHVRCAGTASASTRLHVLDMARPTVGPPTGGGGTAGAVPAAALLLAGGVAAVGVGAGLLLRQSSRPHLSWLRPGRRPE